MPPCFSAFSAGSLKPLKASTARVPSMASNSTASPASLSRGATPGTPFDPRHHEAVVSVPGTGRPEGEIVDEIRRGYKLRDRVIRPSLVAVAAAGDGADAGPIN